MSRFLFSAVLMIFVSSCAWFAPPKPIKDPDFLAAEKQLLSENYTGAVRGYSRYLSAHGKGREAADAYYGRGMAHYALKEYSLARLDFERCLKNQPSKEIRAIALLRLAECAMIQEDFAAAEKAYKTILKEAPDAFGEDEILYRLGIACLRQAHWDDAEKYLGRLIREFPHSPRRTLAQEKMPGVERYFSVQVAAYTKRSVAEQTKEKLRRKGFDAFIQIVTRDGQTYYCVRSGKFQYWSQVKRHAADLAAAGFRNVMKVP